MEQLQHNETAALDGLLIAERTMRVVMKEFSPRTALRQVQVLIAIYQNEPASRAEVMGVVKGTRNSILNDLYKLGGSDRFGKTGLGMISGRWESAFPPYRVFSLTPYGKDVVRQLADALDRAVV